MTRAQPRPGITPEELEQQRRRREELANDPATEGRVVFDSGWYDHVDGDPLPDIETFRVPR